MMCTPMFEGSISLPQNPREAALIAENLEALARALREWPADTWQKVGTAAAAEPEGSSAGLFERLVAPSGAGRAGLAPADPGGAVRRSGCWGSARAVAHSLVECRGVGSDVDLLLGGVVMLASAGRRGWLYSRPTS